MKKNLVKLIKFGAILIFLNHFLQTIFYLTPTNILKEDTKLGTLNSSYMRPYFDQVWTLFAPTPVRTDTLLLVQCLPKNPDSKPKPKRWVDILTPIWKANQRNRLTAYDRFSRTIENPLRDIIQIPFHLTKAAKKCDAGDKSICEDVKIKRKKHRDKSIDNVRKAASVYCMNYMQQNSLSFDEVSRIALRIRVVTPPPWKDRYDKSKATQQDFDLGVHSTVQTKAPLIYRSMP